MEGENFWPILYGHEPKPESPTNSVQDCEHREKKEKVLLRMYVKDYYSTYQRFQYVQGDMGCP